MYYRLITAYLLLILSGCQILGSNDKAIFQLETDKMDFRAGEDLQLALTNLSGKTYTIHPELCGAILQISKNLRWETIEQEGACTRVGTDLIPGQQIQIIRRLSSDLENGRYRYEYVIGDIAVQSQYFEIRD